MYFGQLRYGIKLYCLNYNFGILQKQALKNIITYCLYVKYNNITIREYNIKESHYLNLQACKDKVDAICSVFSFDDATGFNDVPYLMNTMTAIKEKPANIVIGTK